MAIRAAIYSRLSGYSGLTSLVSTRISTKEITQKTVKPCVYFEFTGIDRVSTIDGDSGMCNAQVRIISVAENTAAALEIADQVRAALQRYSGTISGTDIRDIFIENEYDEYESDTDESNIEQFFTIGYIE